LDETPQQEFRAGLIYGLIAYSCWGLVPLYFQQLAGVDLLEVLSHRIVWSLPLMLLLVACQSRGFTALWRTLTTRKLVLALAASSVFLTANWLLYIYATSTHRVAEASLGYFMLPLVNAVLARVFLGEVLRPLHYPALALILLGVFVPMLAKGELLWLPIALPVTFGLYGLIRKTLPVDGSIGLTVETLLLSGPSWAYIATRTFHGTGLVGVDANATFWFVFGGVVTVVPLLTFTLSVRRLPLLTQSFIQFISPMVQIAVAVFLLHDEVSWDRWLALACVLAAVSVFIIDAVLKARTTQRIRRAEREAVGVGHD